jgi:multiple sugar transport system permease protein
MVRSHKKLLVCLSYIGLLAGLAYTFFPILWMFFASVKNNAEIFSLPPRLLPKVFTAQPYLKIIQDGSKVRFFLNSYLVAVMVTALTVFVSILSGYSFSRHTFKFKKVLNLFIITTQTVPLITLLIPYFGIVVALGLYDTYLALILTYMVFTLPYAILMMTGYFNTLPKELDEAVMVDGGSNFFALWRVLVPNAVPGIVATGIYTFLLSWNEFLFALTLTKSTEMRTVPIGIQLLMGQHAYEWNEMMAMGILGSLPILILYLFAQRYFLAGMTAGAVKD